MSVYITVLFTELVLEKFTTNLRRTGNQHDILIIHLVYIAHMANCRFRDRNSPCVILFQIYIKCTRAGNNHSMK